jgi:hypothetical protein
VSRTLAVIVLVAAAPAHADRSPVLEVGAVLDGRSTATTFDQAGKQEVRLLAGAQLVVGFEDAPLAIPAPGEIDADLRLVPELIAGFVADDRHGEGYVGGGLRGELHFASNRRGYRMRTVAYTAARAIAIGENRDGAVELVLGEYLYMSRDRRFGWEGGALIRPRAERSDERELDAVVSIYVGW